MKAITKAMRAQIIHSISRQQFGVHTTSVPYCCDIRDNIREELSRHVERSHLFTLKEALYLPLSSTQIQSPHHPTCKKLWALGWIITK